MNLSSGEKFMFCLIFNIAINIFSQPQKNFEEKRMCFILLSDGIGWDWRYAIRSEKVNYKREREWGKEESSKGKKTVAGEEANLNEGRWDEKRCWSHLNNYWKRRPEVLPRDFFFSYFPLISGEENSKSISVWSSSILWAGGGRSASRKFWCIIQKWKRESSPSDPHTKNDLRSQSHFQVINHWELSVSTIPGHSFFSFPTIPSLRRQKVIRLFVEIQVSYRKRVAPPDAQLEAPSHLITPFRCHPIILTSDHPWDDIILRYLINQFTGQTESQSIGSSVGSTPDRSTDHIFFKCSQKISFCSSLSSFLFFYCNVSVILPVS